MTSSNPNKQPTLKYKVGDVVATRDGYYVEGYRPPCKGYIALVRDEGDGKHPFPYYVEPIKKWYSESSLSEIHSMSQEQQSALREMVTPKDPDQWYAEINGKPTVVILRESSDGQDRFAVVPNFPSTFMIQANNQFAGVNARIIDPVPTLNEVRQLRHRIADLEAQQARVMDVIDEVQSVVVVGELGDYEIGFKHACERVKDKIYKAKAGEK
jgi:hypothetical protein